MSGFIEIPLPVLRDTTDVHHERNIYVHPNPVARAIFWQRLYHGFRLVEPYAPPQSRVLDFGGGSGVFLPTLAGHFADVTVIDVDLDDARRLVEHYKLNNVRILKQDITAWPSDEQFDLVVAMDVLEHFENPEVPFQFFAKHLRPGGLLLMSLPTENFLYEFGRLIVRKQKPIDHYHPAAKLVRFYRERGYERLTHCFVPRVGSLAVPLFSIGLFRKPD